MIFQTISIACSACRASSKPLWTEPGAPSLLIAKVHRLKFGRSSEKRVTVCALHRDGHELPVELIAVHVKGGFNQRVPA